MAVHSDFDPGLMEGYQKPKYLLHFQFGDSSKVYRYSLVETIDQSQIHHRLKTKKMK